MIKMLLFPLSFIFMSFILLLITKDNCVHVQFVADDA